MPVPYRAVQPPHVRRRRVVHDRRGKHERMQLAHEDIEAWVHQFDGSAPREGRLLVERHIRRSGRVEQAREGVDRVGLASYGDLHRGVWGDNGQGLSAGRNLQPFPTHFEPRARFIGGNEVHDTGVR